VSAAITLSAMRTHGALVLSGAVSADLADALRAHVDAELASSLRMARTDPVEERARFGDVLARHCRYDLKLQLDAPPVRAALWQLFRRPGALLETMEVRGDD
jgi:hypothetical protein